MLLPNNFFNSNFENYKKSLKDISLDSANKISLCNYASPLFFSFDDIVKNKTHFKKTPKTFDTFVFFGNKLFCIEFKNSPPENITEKDVQDKAVEGLLSLFFILCKNNINIGNYKKYYFTIFKTSSSSEYMKRRTQIKFGLDKFKGKFYDDILTIECGGEFMEKLKEVGIELA